MKIEIAIREDDQLGYLFEDDKVKDVYSGKLKVQGIARCLGKITRIYEFCTMHILREVGMDANCDFAQFEKKSGMIEVIIRDAVYDYVVEHSRPIYKGLYDLGHKQKKKIREEESHHVEIEIDDEYIDRLFGALNLFVAKYGK